jgi:hypothetical protein
MINFLFSGARVSMTAIRRIQYLKSYRGYRKKQVENIRKAQALWRLRINSINENKKEKSKVFDRADQGDEEPAGRKRRAEHLCNQAKSAREKNSPKRWQPRNA